MLAAPKFGFVYLATRKTGSTAIQKAFRRHAQLVTTGPPSMKHVNAAEFEESWAPIFLAHGYERTAYETACAVREPIDATLSWWRYRSRPDFETRDDYSAGMSFDEFAERVVAGDIWVFPAAEFVAGGVDRIFRYDHLDRFVDWMRAKVGKPVPLGQANVSPPRTTTVSPSTRSKLEEFFAADLAIYEQAE